MKSSCDHGSAKIPVTVLSRCLQFQNLKQMPPAAIVKHLEHIMKEEKILPSPKRWGSLRGQRPQHARRAGRISTRRLRIAPGRNRDARRS